MTTRQVAEGWTLTEWLSDFEGLSDYRPWHPTLEGPKDLSAEVDDEGLLVVEGWADYTSRVRVPLTAISALMSAHAEWLEKTRKEPTK